MLDPNSAILNALYRRQPDEATRLAERATSLTIWEAAALGRDANVLRLIDADRSLINAYAPDGHFPLGLAAFFGHAATVRLLLSAGADVDAVARNSMRVQSLHAAVASRNLEAVTAIVEHGANVNARQQAGYTPLMGAASAGRLDIAELLLARGADPALISEDGKSAAVIAQEHGHASLAELLAGRVTPTSAGRSTSGSTSPEQ
jgi:uncharacterized protein